MNFLLETPSGEGLGATLLWGGQIVLIGMVTIFAVLGLIWACLTIFKILFHDLPEKRTQKAVVVNDVPRETDNAEVNDVDENEIIAVIAAAIAAAESEAPGVKFRVVSFSHR